MDLPYAAEDAFIILLRSYWLFYGFDVLIENLVNEKTYLFEL